MMNIITNVAVKGIACAVPKQHFTLSEYIPDLLNDKTAKRLVRTTGFTSLRIAPNNMTTSDLVFCAAEPMLNDIDRADIGALVFVTQTPDYIVPATGHILQDRLGLRNDVLCIDIVEGCSGYVTGLFTASMLVRQLNRPVLLGVGDTSSKDASPTDRASRCIFGDAGSISLLTPIIDDDHSNTRGGGGQNSI